jgi:MFS-type transporter involved in bile tolerance (Atg22 family)
VSAATGLEYLIVASIFFGLVLGMQESTYRAAVTKFAPIQSRGRAYGIFNTAYGVAFLVSGVSYGLLLDLKAPFVLILLFVIVLQTLAVVVLPRTSSEARETPEFAV